MWGNVKVETNFEDSGMGGRIILDIKEIGWECGLDLTGLGFLW
jgi:hypothetical protein